MGRIVTGAQQYDFAKEANPAKNALSTKTASGHRLNITATREPVNDSLLTRKQAVAVLQAMNCVVSYSQLSKWANRGDGPPFTRYAWGATRYSHEDLRAWAAKVAKRIG